jgi:hypothetical protein
MILFWSLPWPKTFGEIELAGLCFHVEVLANLSFKYSPVGKHRLREINGFALRRAKVWFPMRQNYGSRHNSPGLILFERECAET